MAALSVVLGSCSLLFETGTPSEADDVRFLSVDYDVTRSASQLRYPVAVPKGDDRALLVAVLLGGSCVSNATPAVDKVILGATELSLVGSVQGVSCNALGTRSEEWLLLDPPVGDAELLITLTSEAESIHSSAMVFGGVDQETPVRAFASSFGQGASSTLTIDSALGDLVVNIVGQGTSVLDPDVEATRRYVSNVDSSNTMNNSAGSTSPGAEEVESSWSFGADDMWQSFSVSLQPSSR